MTTVTKHVDVEVDLSDFDDDEIYDEADKRGLLVTDNGLSDACAFVAEELSRLCPDKREQVFDAMRNCEYGRIGLLVE